MKLDRHSPATGPYRPIHGECPLSPNVLQPATPAVGPVVDYEPPPFGAPPALPPVTVLRPRRTVSTVGTITNIPTIGGYPAQMQIIDNNRTAWAQCVRARIT